MPKTGQVLGSKELNSQEFRRTGVRGSSEVPEVVPDAATGTSGGTPQKPPNHLFFVSFSGEIMGNHGKSWEIMGNHG